MKRVMLAIPALFLAGAVCAEDSLYGAAMAGVALRDRDLPVSAGPSVQLLVGKPLGLNFSLEGSLYGERNDADHGGGHVDAYGLGLNVSYQLPVLKNVQPFLLGGAGVHHDRLTDVGRDNQKTPYLDFGAGLHWPALERSALRFRGELRGYLLQYSDFPGGNLAVDWRLNLGVEYGLPKSAPPPPPAPEPVAAPPPPPAPAPLPPAVVRDSDNDGVVDPLDQCPDTPAGFKVDADGCVVVEEITLGDVYFEFNADQFRPELELVLDSIVMALQVHRDLRLEIAGHTDAIGSQAYNQRLSDRRAQNVRRYLVYRGIAADRLVAKGYGKRQPVDSNKTAAGRAHNRRVEFRALNVTAPVPPPAPETPPPAAPAPAVPTLETAPSADAPTADDNGRPPLVEEPHLLEPKAPPAEEPPQP